MLIVIFVHSGKLLKSIVKEELMIESAIYKEVLAKGREESILDVLTARFESIPDGVQQKVHSIKDNAVLKKLIKIAATAKDLSEFEKHLNA